MLLLFLWGVCSEDLRIHSIRGKVILRKRFHLYDEETIATSSDWQPGRRPGKVECSTYRGLTKGQPPSKVKFVKQTD